MDDATERQLAAALAVLTGALGPGRVRGAYLYGSAVAGGLRPDSDLDLFVVTDQPLSDPEKVRLVEGLLPISGRQTRPPGWRPIELTSVAQDDVRPWRYPPRMDFLYGEWLREELLAGRIEPARPNPDLGVLVTMVRQTGRPLIGPPPTELLEPVSPDELARAMLDTIPSLLADLEDDTRNVLLTLVRIWLSVATGGIRPKDVAADWALARLPEEDRPMLARARDLYRSGGYGDWPDTRGVRELAERMVHRIRDAAA